MSPLRKSQNGTLNLSLLWYGQFTPVQKERAHGLGICNETYALTINGSIKGLSFSLLIALYWKIDLFSEIIILPKRLLSKKNNKTI